MRCSDRRDPFIFTIFDLNGKLFFKPYKLNYPSETSNPAWAMRVKKTEQQSNKPESDHFHNQGIVWFFGGVLLLFLLTQSWTNTMRSPLCLGIQCEGILSRSSFAGRQIQFSPLSWGFNCFLNVFTSTYKHLHYYLCDCVSMGRMRNVASYFFVFKGRNRYFITTRSIIDHFWFLLFFWKFNHFPTVELLLYNRLPFIKLHI